MFLINIFLISMDHYFDLDTPPSEDPYQRNSHRVAFDKGGLPRCQLVPESDSPFPRRKVSHIPTAIRPYICIEGPAHSAHLAPEHDHGRNGKKGLRVALKPDLDNLPTSSSQPQPALPLQ
jgi:hypothetical protein